MFCSLPLHTHLSIALALLSKLLVWVLVQLFHLNGAFVLASERDWIWNYTSCPAVFLPRFDCLTTTNSSPPTFSVILYASINKHFILVCRLVATHIGNLSIKKEEEDEITPLQLHSCFHFGLINYTEGELYSIFSLTAIQPTVMPFSNSSYEA